MVKSRLSLCQSSQFGITASFAALGATDARVSGIRQTSPMLGHCGPGTMNDLKAVQHCEGLGSRAAADSRQQPPASVAAGWRVAGLAMTLLRGAYRLQEPFNR